jgi:hypothetical protein
MPHWGLAADDSTMRRAEKLAGLTPHRYIVPHGETDPPEGPVSPSTDQIHSSAKAE